VAANCRRWRHSCLGLGSLIPCDHLLVREALADLSELSCIVIRSVVNDPLGVDIGLPLRQVLHCVRVLHRVVVLATEGVVVIFVELDDLPRSLGKAHGIETACLGCASGL